MFEYLIDHALKNAWCTPRQDQQVILEPARISPAVGIFNKTPHMWGSLPLPTLGERYYLYQVGQVEPSILGLVRERRVWTKLSDMMAVEKLYADVYVNSGLHLSRSETWVMVTEERNLLIAVKDQPRITSLRNQDIFVRLYSNSYFSSDRADGVVHAIECVGDRITSLDHALTFQQAFHASRLRIGSTLLFVNGKYVDDYPPSVVQVGDIVEYVYDSTVKAVYDFKIEDLDTFESVLDNKFKYLVHYSGSQTDGVGIDYRDDIDLYLLNKQTISSVVKWDGVYFHKNQNDAFRMVTHRDYAVAVPYITGYTLGQPTWPVVQDLTLRMFVRYSGYKRPLIDEHHRIKELYKLDESDRVDAMIGLDSTVPVWQAPALENSYYTKIMDAINADVSATMVQYGYGYNAISKLVADSPRPVEVASGVRLVRLPYGLQSNATMFEYDSQGRLLEFHHHVFGQEYLPANPQTQLVEGLMGRGSQTISTVFAAPEVLLNQSGNYRFYNAPLYQGQIQHDQWEDVTGDSSKYVVIGDIATWLVDLNATAVAVKSDRDFLAYNLTLSPQNGLLKFSVEATATYPTGAVRGVMYIPFGNLDLWLNGRALVEGLDYYVNWPEIVIVNKAYLVPGDAQVITVRATGFCSDEMVLPDPKEVGFVRYGLLSRDNRFGVRDDKVIRIVVDGKVFHRSALIFSEDDSGVRMENVPNGAPYVIEDVIVPIRGLVNETAYTLRAQALEVDTAIENYLTLKLPEPVKTPPDIILEKYPIYSPFSSTVMHDLINGIIAMEDFQGQYSDLDVRDRLESYEYLLEYDPTQKVIDLEHVSIHPHNLNVVTELNIYQYNFLARAIKTYLEDRVDITRFVSIKPGWI